MKKSENSQIAVGLQYKPHFPAPRILFKSKGFLADKVLLLAQKYQVPLKSDQVLSEVLFSLPEGSWIPEEQFSVIAEILSQIYSFKGSDDENRRL